MRLDTLIAVVVIASANAFTNNPIPSCKQVIAKNPMINRAQVFERRAVMELSASQDSLVAAGAALFAGLGAFLSGRSASVSKPAKATTSVAKQAPAAKFDVSIPYDAAANLAYFAWKGDQPYSDETFQSFKKIYEQKAVAEVTRKRVLREYDESIKKLDDELSSLLSKASGSNQ